MKKTILILAAFALVAFSCTKTEVKDDTPKKGINFSAYTAKPTKAPLGPQVDVITENLEKFEVTAIGNGATYFDNVTFKKNTVWESDTKYFWPAFPLTFCAYNTPTVNAEGGTTFERTITTSEQKLFVAPNADLAKQEDLVAAYAAGKIEGDATSTGKSLPINFNHYLTQVIVKAKNSSSTYKVVVDGVKLANLAGDGTYTFSDNKMTATASKVNSGTSSDYSASFTEKTLDGTAAEVMTDGVNGRWYLIPQSVAAWSRSNTTNIEPESIMTNASHGTYLALKVKITANNGTLKIYPSKDKDEQSGYVSGWMAVPVPAQLKFEQGKKYVITVDFFSSTGNGAGYVDPEQPSELDGDALTNDNGKKIIGGEIKFNATVEDWDDNKVEITISL